MSPLIDLQAVGAAVDEFAADVEQQLTDAQQAAVRANIDSLRGNFLRRAQEAGFNGAPMVAVADRAVRDFNAVFTLAEAQNRPGSPSESLLRASVATLAAMSREVDNLGPEAQLVAKLEETVRDLHERETQAGRDLQSAIEATDIDAVDALRAELEIQLPQALDTAELALAAARVDAAKEAVKKPSTLASECDHQVATAQERLDRAKVELQRAAAAAERANTEMLAAHGARAQAEAAVEVRVSERSLTTERIESGKRRRFRRLAGLPDETTSAPNATDPAPALESALGPPQWTFASDGYDIHNGQLRAVEHFDETDALRQSRRSS